MSPVADLRFLRPYLHTDISTAQKVAYRSFASTTSRLGSKKHLLPTEVKSFNKLGPTNSIYDRHFCKERLKELANADALHWPRIKREPSAIGFAEFKSRYSSLAKNQQQHKDRVVVRGKLSNVRIAGSKLIFLDIVQDGQRLQVVCNYVTLGGFADVTPQEFKRFYHLVRRGDILSVTGRPYTTTSGQLSVLCETLPQILSPSLAIVPLKLEDRETRIRNRHVDLLVNQHVPAVLRLRSKLIQSIRNFLLDDNFLEVQTPLIVHKASGAVAKAFVTNATEFPEKKLALRVAPEIWLKRLVIGGMDRVFEIGPAFRNEGLDATHNPEFTTCEFYKSYAELEELIDMTEALFARLVRVGASMSEAERATFSSDIDIDAFTAPFKRIEFIPAIEAGLGTKLPNLEGAEVEEEIIELFKVKNLPLPISTTLPRLLDKLATFFIEPSCVLPTFITHHPALMSPLAKSFVCPQTKQLVSARAELFVNCREIANMYEEENSPLAQREKFIQQQRWKDDENDGSIDESYLEALEWALPPTGGWGCGIDRIVMLFSGRDRISDVLSFGSLRNVVNLSNRGDVVKPEAGSHEHNMQMLVDRFQRQKADVMSWAGNKTSMDRRQELLKQSMRRLPVMY